VPGYGWDLVALTDTDQAVSVNDNQTWALRGKTFNCCMLDTEHSSRWDNRNIILQQVVKDSKWKIRSTVVEKNTVACAKSHGRSCLWDPGRWIRFD